MKAPPSTLLGFDYGEWRIGVATGQWVTATAQPLETLHNRERHAVDWTAVGALIKAWQPDAVVVGYPTEDDGTPYPVARAARKFANRIHGRYGLPVHLADERLTSDEARRLAREAGQSDDKPIDALAAAIILETWIQVQARG
ncbi:MAG: Holliday junction resolvase RuvX [Halothiobacillaceae bacterium]